MSHERKQHPISSDQPECPPKMQLSLTRDMTGASLNDCLLLTPNVLIAPDSGSVVTASSSEVVSCRTRGD
jgi:hypothetical protein